MKTYKDEFKEWAETKQEYKFFNKLSDVTNDYREDLETGQTCTFINYCFVVFPGKTIMGFCEPQSYGGCVFLDNDCYWHPTDPKYIFLNTNLMDNIHLRRDKNCLILEIFRIPCVIQSYEKNKYVNLSPIQTGLETIEESLDNIRIDFTENEITTDGRKTFKWINFTSYLKPHDIEKFLHDYELP